jgi:histidyl-tRNA synthetase
VYQVPRGTRDFTPDEMQKRRYVEECMRNTFQKFGYKEIQTPTFETLELFTAKSGEAIVNELYSFTDKSGRELALRPELTAPVMRFYVDKLQMEPKPLKLFYFGNCFRYDRPQKGRYREFWQMGCELIGSSNPEAIAELIALAYYALKETGLKGIILRIGNLDYLDQQMEKILQTDTDISKYHPGSAAEWKSDMSRFIDKEDYEGIQNQLRKIDANPKDVKEFNEFLKSGSVSDLKTFIETSKLEIYEKVIRHLKEFDIDQIKIEMKIARGLDYYKGIVFEIDAPVLGAEKQICGGGVYDLVKSFGGKDVPTAGFAIGFDRTILALETEDYPFPTPKIDIYIIPLKEDIIGEALKIAQMLREKGVSVDVDLLRRGINKSLKYANSINAGEVIIIGSKELEKNIVTVKNMTNGKQEQVNINKYSPASQRK